MWYSWKAATEPLTSGCISRQQYIYTKKLESSFTFVSINVAMFLFLDISFKIVRTEIRGWFLILGT